MWSKDDCINALRTAAEQIGESPTIREYRDLDIDGPSEDTIRDRFGTWNDAKEAAGLEAFEYGDWHQKKIATYRHDDQGYAKWVDQVDGYRVVLVHRLLAVAEYGFDAVQNRVVHHSNGVKWDNRPENIEIKTMSDHQSDHGVVDKAVQAGFEAVERDERGRFK